jgi:hypothetical protein
VCLFLDVPKFTFIRHTSRHYYNFNPDYPRDPCVELIESGTDQQGAFVNYVDDSEINFERIEVTDDVLTKGADADRDVSFRVTSRYFHVLCLFHL